MADRILAKSRSSEKKDTENLKKLAERSSSRYRGIVDFFGEDLEQFWELFYLADTIAKTTDTLTNEAEGPVRSIYYLATMLRERMDGYGDRMEKRMFEAQGADRE